MPFIPHTENNIKEMLETIGAKNLEDLFDEIPKDLLTADLSTIPTGLTEMELGRILRERAKQDQSALCFMGAGAYEHHIPAAVWDVTSRGEFMTAYTPYQAEASQGGLQLLYEYQTMMASLMGLEVSNASLYDGASALAEAILMAARANTKSKSHRILMPRTVHPHYRQVVQAIVKQQEIEIEELPLSAQDGYTDPEVLKKYSGQDITALVIPQPNFFGTLEEVDTLTDWAHAQGALVIGVVNPIAMALLKPPGQWGTKGADIACGEGQPLGIPLASGGPYFGFLCCKKSLIRQLPGRIVGRTLDKEGKEGFVLTLQAREQHIRRAKATSNICTNQGLMVTAATIFMSLLGPEGLRRVALAAHANCKSLCTKLASIDDVKLQFSRPMFHEAVLHLPRNADETLAVLADCGIIGGYALQHFYPELQNCILVCATETKTEQDLEIYKNTLKDVLTERRGYAAASKASLCCPA